MNVIFRQFCWLIFYQHSLSRLQHHFICKEYLTGEMKIKFIIICCDEHQRKKLNQRCVEINILSNMRSIWFSLYAAFEKDRLPQLYQVQKLLQLQTNYFSYSKYCKFSKLNPPLTTNTPSTLSTSKTSAATNVYNIAQKKNKNKKKQQELQIQELHQLMQLHKKHQFLQPGKALQLQ